MTIRIGLIGLGAASNNIHLPAYAMLQDKISVVGGCDVNENARNYTKKRWNMEEIYSTPEEMIDKTSPDIVSIITPPSLHFEGCRTALEKGCHVFCEKPFMESLEQVDMIIEAAAKSKRFVVVNNEFRYMQIHSKAKELIGRPEFGELRYLYAWQTFTPNAHTEAGWRGNLEKRVCFEFGNHVFDLIRFFFGENPVKIFAHMPKPVPDIKTDFINVVTVEFADGRAASFILDRLSKGPERYLDMRLDGDHASIHTFIGGELRFQIGIHTKIRKPFAQFSMVKGGKAELQIGNKSSVIAKDPINPFQAATSVLLSRFIDALKNDMIPPCNAKESRDTLALIFAAYDSSSSGLPVVFKK